MGVTYQVGHDKSLDQSMNLDYEIASLTNR